MVFFEVTGLHIIWTVDFLQVSQQFGSFLVSILHPLSSKSNIYFMLSHFLSWEDKFYDRTFPEEINYRNNQQFLVYLHQGTRPCYLQLTNDELLLLSRVMSNLELLVYLGRIKCSMMCRVGLLLRDKFRKLFNFVIKAMFTLGGKSWIFGKCVQHWDGISSVVLHASFFSKPQFSFDYYKNKAAGYRGFQGVLKPEGKYCTISGKCRHCTLLWSWGEK